MRNDTIEIAFPLVTPFVQVFFCDVSNLLGVVRRHKLLAILRGRVKTDVEQDLLSDMDWLFGSRNSQLRCSLTK